MAAHKGIIVIRSNTETNKNIMNKWQELINIVREDYPVPELYRISCIKSLKTKRLFFLK